MKPFKKVILTFKLSIDYTDNVNEAIGDGDLKTKGEVKDFVEDLACDAIGNHLLQYSDLLSDMTLEIE
jgi:hypothetical protein